MENLLISELADIAIQIVKYNSDSISIKVWELGISEMIRAN
jgi:hypothetical protein